MFSARRGLLSIYPTVDTRICPMISSCPGCFGSSVFPRFLSFCPLPFFFALPLSPVLFVIYLSQPAYTLHFALTFRLSSRTDEHFLNSFIGDMDIFLYAVQGYLRTGANDLDNSRTLDKHVHIYHCIMWRFIFENVDHFLA